MKGAGLLVTVATLAACGGGGDAAAAAANGAKAPAVLEATGDAGWTTVASEGTHFTFAGTQTVRYGIGDAWITVQRSGGGDCTNDAFGSDPAYGIVKVCQTSAAPAADTGWTTLAAEGASYSVVGSQTVRYGSGAAWVAQQVTGGGMCSNAAFGGDPLPGVVKQCQVAASAWTRIAGENESITLSGTQRVRYGSGAQWITRDVGGNGICSNAFFGSDPVVGTVKECDVAGAAATPPAPAPVVAGVCTPPIGAVDTSGTAATVGTGTPASCTEAALRAAVNANAIVKFDCGAAPATIAIASTIDVPATRDTVVDGENRVTLDGGGRTRIFNLYNANYRTNAKGLTLQHIALKNGKAPGTGYVAPNPANAACAYGYADGGGGAIQVRDARLYAIDVDFDGNAAASPGPDVGGGAIYAAGSLDVVVSGSRFSGNSGANAGAIGALQSNLRVYNGSFSGNTANGSGMNYAGGAASGCPGVGHPGQGGAGGNGGAITIDGSDDTDVIVCGTSFAGNHANELAGALFRTANITPRRTTLDRSVFQNNSARQGGALFIMNAAPLTIQASTFSSNTAVVFGAGQFQNAQFDIVNSTFSGNEATRSLAGALYLNGSSASSTIRNTTFAGNKASGGVGYFGAALFGDSNFTVVNTVFAANTTLDPWNPMQCGFVALAGANNVQWPPNRAVGGAADNACVTGIAYADPLLGALAANGGPTPTRSPAANSPLRGAGRNCPATDQRGKARDAASCTVGAVE